MVFPKDKVDYSLYLVTNSTMLPPGTTMYSQVEEGLKNGVTLVQIREKDCDTKNFVSEALIIRSLCSKYKVPLIINDRIDVALAIGADGVHVGQNDMPIPLVRELLGPDKIIGWSVGKVEEIEKLAKWGSNMVDNIGIGMVFPTATKTYPKISPMGPQGVIEILDALETNGVSWVKTVAIGGLHPNNIERVLYQCVSTNSKRSLDGIAVVSDIMASETAGKSAKVLRDLLNQPSYNFLNLNLNYESLTLGSIQDIISQLTVNRPLVHHITNKVHQNFGANVTLAVGASPIMSDIESEVEELSKISNSSLLINTGTIAPIDMLKTAISAYNIARRPIVFDPVGYSATETRYILNNTILSYGQFSCIKGNIGEILSLAHMEGNKMRGVDSESQQVDTKLLIDATRFVAYKYKTITVCTGRYDIVVDGTVGGSFSLGFHANRIRADKLKCVVVNGGEIPIMGEITASGCSLGSTIACFIGGLSAGGNMYHAVVGAVLLYKTAGKLASSRCKGSGSFHVELIDALYQLSNENCPENWDISLDVLK